jgi:uncharacterized protein YndB with AHSA1/START domain
MDLPYRLDRVVLIEAPQAIVFSFLTEPDRWASWWGTGSTIDARAGGRVFIRHPNGIEISGEVIDVAPPERIVFTYGFDAGTPIPPGGSTVTIRLTPTSRGTRLHLAHEFADAGVRDEHQQGWRYQLSRFGNVATDLAHAGAAAAVDAWFEAWTEPDAAARGDRLRRIAAAEVRFRDRFALVDGIPDLVPHIGAAQRFMPGLRLRRSGAVRHCQGTLLVDWIASDPGGVEQGRGINVFSLQPDGLIDAVVGFWGG